MAADPLINKIFQTKQVQALQKNGFDSVFSIIINFPFRYEKIQALTSQVINEQEKFLVQGEVLSITKTPKYFLVSILSDNGQRRVDCYYFVRAQFVSRVYYPGVKIQAEITKKKGFVSIVRMSVLRTIQQGSQTLGNREFQDYILPIYSKQGTLKSSEWTRIHDRLTEIHYQLNLEGLVPVNDILPTNLNLLKAHKPKNLDEAYEAIRQYNLLRIFLKLAFNKHTARIQQDRMARSSSRDKEFMTSMSQLLAFDLSLSQKQVIWEILGGFDFSVMSQNTVQV